MGKLFFFILFSFCSLASAQTGFKLKISGEITQTLELSLSDLSKMPRKNATMKDKEGKVHSYTGVSVLDILAAAKVPSGKELHGENMSKYLLVKCADGYQVLFSLAELDPSIADKTVIVADTVDGKPLPDGKGPLRIIAEGEKKPARSSYQVTELIIGAVKK
ncbi:molybdopterin-binding protein [Chryseobacterium lactis]|uniref:Molybdopterin-binding protein n=1 Tax=Chryseobacterium lactis TaxID=1241981 RepID=A0A3G6RNF3_CHRLC|nr:molybdopterin-dependent oxidoreductase [Chryseobacterium lactis]AZA84351.1 molybdopterin-binding protein [Chryseobacterium lactis]AZB04739.1 molybdopterin-binding protein [Chryseobacterium lactis]PNW14470.1 molybdopterin-binding protein [Chryseobacterium lactis]